MSNDIVVPVFANNYNWPVKIRTEDFSDLFEWTDDYIHGVISSACLSQHMVHVRDRSDIVIEGFDNIRERILTERITKALIGE